MTTQKEAKQIFGEEVTRLAEKAAERCGVTRNGHGELPAVPLPLIVAEAVREFHES